MKKYRLPSTHECFQNATVEDLLVEFYEDYYAEHESEARAALSEDGEFTFSETGDPLFDKWEKELAKGLTPDLEEGYSQEEKAKLVEERARKQKLRKDMSLLGEVSEDYTKTNTQYASKFATPGSKEEQALRSGSLGSGQQPGVKEVWEDLLGTD